MLRRAFLCRALGDPVLNGIDIIFGPSDLKYMYVHPQASRIKHKSWICWQTTGLNPLFS